MGKAAAELKLLACQRNDQTWSAVQGEEIVPAEAAGNFEQGALVLANLGGNRQIQGELEPGGPRLASLLQNLSKYIGEKKAHEEEIEAWNQSLTLQAQELNKREMELEAELTQLEQMREEAAGLEEKLNEAEKVKEEATQIQANFDRKSQELEQAWEHLRGEQRKLEELKGEVAPSGGLDEEQAAQIQEIVASLEGNSAAALGEQFDLARAAVESQQAALDSQWQALEQQRAEAQAQQEQVQRESEALHDRQQQLQDARQAVEQARQDLREQQNALAVKQEAVKRLHLDLQVQTELHDSLSRLAAGVGDGGGETAVDLAALENMPLGELQGITESLQQDLKKDVQFVNDQEEELTLERQDLDELEEKLKTASEYDRINLEQELSDARDRYKMLDETLVGQRRKVRERESVLSAHLRILRRRQGILDEQSDAPPAIDLNPVLEALEERKTAQQEEVKAIESEIEQMQASIGQVEALLEQQMGEQERHQQEIQALEESLQQVRVSAARSEAQAVQLEATLQPWQAALNEGRQQLEAIAQSLAQVRQTSERQTQAIDNLKALVSSLS